MKNKNKTNRGISPLISWILLVGMVVAIGAFIYGWSTNFVRHQVIIDNSQIYCDTVSMKVISACRNESVLAMNLSNTGTYNITSFTVFRSSEATLPGSCLKLLDNPLRPGDTLIYNFDIDMNFTSNETLEECPEAGTPKDVNGNVSEFSIIPWVNIEKQTACSDKKITVNTQDANTAC